MTPNFKYNAFISYYRDQDIALADAIQKGLRSLGAKKYLLKFRALEVFRDEINNEGNGGAHQRIMNGLDQSEFLILLVSKKGKDVRIQNKQNDWMDIEIRHWLQPKEEQIKMQRKKSDKLKIIICITDGEINCQKGKDEYDWNITDCLPNCLINNSALDTNWIDLREIKNKTAEGQNVLSLEYPEFKQKIAEISSKIQHITVDKIISKDIVYKQIGRLAIIISSLLMLTLTALSISFGIKAELNKREAMAQKDSANVNKMEALSQRDSAKFQKHVAEQKADDARTQQLIADEQKNRAIHADSIAQEQKTIAISQKSIALAQSYANAAYALTDKDPTMSISFANKALSINENNNTACTALLKAFNSGSWFYNKKWENIYNADLSNDGQHIIIVDNTKNVKLIDLSTDQEISLSQKSTNASFLPNGNILLWTPWEGVGTLGDIFILNSSGRLITKYSHQFLRPTICPGGNILVPAFKDDSLVLFKIDQNSGKENMLKLPSDFDNLSIICNGTNNSIIISQDIPGITCIIDSDGKNRIIELPDNYYVRDIDINNNKAVLYLVGTKVGIADDLGIVKLNTKDNIQIIPLREIKEFDHSGSVRFLNNNNVVVSATNGWSEIISLSTNESNQLMSSRATDAISVSSKQDFFVMARRSGEASLYDFNGICVGRLLGTEASDGLNPAFTNVKIDSDAKMILTVDRNGARLWLRPRYLLKIPLRKGNDIDSVSQDVISYYESYQHNKIDFKNAVIDRNSTSFMPINNMGQIGLRFDFNGQTDVFQTELLKGVDDVSMSGKISNFGYCLYSGEAQRLYILSVSIINNITEEETRQKKMWQVDDKTLKRWL